MISIGTNPTAKSRLELAPLPPDMYNIEEEQNQTAAEMNFKLQCQLLDMKMKRPWNQFDVITK